MAYTPEILVEALREEPQTMWVRLAAQWLTHGEPTGPEPELTGDRRLDALVAATVAHRARLLGLDAPDWIYGEGRTLETLWHPGPPVFFGWSLAHAPAEFKARGVLIEADSLISV